MSGIDHLYIVGAGFSHYAGLPLASGFTPELLDIRLLKKNSASAIQVAWMKQFVDEVFGAGIQLAPSEWPQLEDLFTTIDLAANTGHNLGPNYSASVLRTMRRALIVRLIRMLDSTYKRKAKRPDAAMCRLQAFFEALPTDRVAFLSMNWDTVIERSLQERQGIREIDYGCAAIPAQFESRAVKQRRVSSKSRTVEVLKPHGSVNWMYCDACSRLYWFPPKSTGSIAMRLFKENDALEVERRVGQRPPLPAHPATCPDCGAQALGTRFATFSFRKALDFPMHTATWRRAETLLQAARTWIFVGYSLPAADYQFKHLLKRIQLSRRDAPEMILVTKTSQGDPTVENYRRFFGRRSIPARNLLGNGLDDSALARLRKAGALE